MNVMSMRGKISGKTFLTALLELTNPRFPFKLSLSQAKAKADLSLGSFKRHFYISLRFLDSM